MDVAITELEKIEADRIDGVGMPANGIPVLLLKAVPVAKGQRDCPKCDKSYDADHQGSTCENCGADLPDAASKADGDDKIDCPTCKGDGKIMGNQRDCPDCDASGKVTPAKAKTLAAKSLAKAVLASLPDGVAKAVGADGQVDEAPDIDKGNQILALLGEAIAAEAAEMAAGQAGEADDILELAWAAQAVRCWRDGEQAVSLGDVMPASMLMQSAMPGCGCCENCTAGTAAKADMSTADINDLPDSAFAYIEDGGSKDDEGKTTPRSLRHFPVHDKAHAENALSRASQSPFGDKAMPKIKAAAEKFGIGDDDTSKSQIAPEGNAVDTVTQGTGDLAQIVEAAVTKAVQPHMERVTALEAELAKVKALPVPGGPMMAAVAGVKAPDGENHAAKAAYYDRMAGSLASPQDADRYRTLAAQERAKITAS